MQSRINCVTEAAGDMLKSFIVMSMKIMFRGGASGAQIRDFLSLYMPEQEQVYNGSQVLNALQDLERDGTVKRQGFTWQLMQ